MRSRLREIIAGRSASAWRRRTERSTAWLREFSTASAWLAARAPLDAAYWHASPFGTRLAEVTAALRYGSPSASAPRHPNTQSTPPQETARARSRDILDHARAPMPVPRSRTGAAVAGHDRRSHHEAGTRSSAISRAQLSALAGQLPRALRSASSRVRDAEHLMRSLGAAHSGDGRMGVEMDAASSSAALARRVTARLDRAFTRAFGQPLSTTLSPDLPPGAIGWNAAMAPPDNNLALATPHASNSVTPSSAVDPVAPSFQRDFDEPPRTSGMASAARPRSDASDSSLTSWKRSIAAPEPALALSPPEVASAALSQSNANDSSLTGWKHPIAAPEPALTLSPPDALAVEIAASAAPTPRAGAQPSRHERLPRHAAPFDASSPTQLSDASPASRSGTQTGAGAASEMVVASVQNDRGGAPAPGAAPADMRPESFQPFMVAPRHPRAPRTAAEASSIGAPWAPTRSAFDQVEFAEFLRRALVDDARRYGIDV
jgi:hypothetical protein